MKEVIVSVIISGGVALISCHFTYKKLKAKLDLVEKNNAGKLKLLLGRINAIKKAIGE